MTKYFNFLSKVLQDPEIAASELPTISVTPNRAYAAIGDNVKFECFFSDFAGIVENIWTKKGKDLPLNAKEFDQIMIIDHVNSENFGEYWCSVLNAEDKTEVGRAKTVLLGMITLS